jgi:hypothetical protein
LGYKGTLSLDAEEISLSKSSVLTKKEFGLNRSGIALGVEAQSENVLLGAGIRDITFGNTSPSSAPPVPGGSSSAGLIPLSSRELYLSYRVFSEEDASGFFVGGTGATSVEVDSYPGSRYSRYSLLEGDFGVRSRVGNRGAFDLMLSYVYTVDPAHATFANGSSDLSFEGLQFGVALALVFLLTASERFIELKDDLPISLEPKRLIAIRIMSSQF